MGRAIRFLAPLICIVGLGILTWRSFETPTQSLGKGSGEEVAIPSPSYPDAQVKMKSEIQPIAMNFATRPDNQIISAPKMRSILESEQLRRLPAISDAFPISDEVTPLPSLPEDSSDFEPSQIPDVDQLSPIIEPSPAIDESILKSDTVKEASTEPNSVDDPQSFALPDPIDHEFKLDEEPVAKAPTVKVPDAQLPNLAETIPELPELPEALPEANVPEVQQQPQNTRRAMAVVSYRADQIIEQAVSLASRNAPYYARAKFLLALRTIADALDASQGITDHVQALETGLGAMREAGDFVPSSADVTVDVHTVASTHKTPVLKHSDDTELSAVIARQKYYTFAQAKLAECCEGVPAGSRALFGLGKLYTVQSHANDASMVNGAKAIVFHRAAMIVDPKNHRATNELAVLMGRYGEFETARDLLLHGLAVKRFPEGWYNLSMVHRHLGENDLAKRATYEYELMTKEKRQGQTPADDNVIRWVNPKAFSVAPVNTPSVPKAANGRPSASSPRRK